MGKHSKEMHGQEMKKNAWFGLLVGTETIRKLHDYR